ncbi:MAG: hypothetical protein LWW83_15255 [Azonexaceae bacterium]|uniref:hypothetical protein n=1 Tax=Azonexus sp. R2A61 TaxID=2744443 RepID=UPI001F319A62|nr:hypothetical protein [Azonexus sp. R2A61]MCE1241272.1 hypothetical protein [Azonexaceae bacterium]
MTGKRRGDKGKRKTAEPRAEYVAAVRYADGSRELFHIRNADDIDDARALVFSQLGDIAAVVIARRSSAGTR